MTPYNPPILMQNPFCQAPALARLSLALFPVFPATRPDPADPTGIVIFCTFRLPRNLQFCMDALFNRID